VAVHAALLARKAGRPIRLIYDRHEDLAATTKRHPGVIRHRTGRQKGWNTGLSGHRDRAGWRGILHADARRPVARGHSCRRSVFLPQCPHPGAGGRHEHPAEWGVPRFGAPSRCSPPS